jgi:hypothetical protein
MRDTEGSGLPGFDGVVQAGRGTPMVPAGLSVWELGVGDDPRHKANDDYSKRAKDHAGFDPATTTFVFATPRQWPGKEAWASEKRLERVWADVQAYDSDNLAIALESAVVVHHWFSELVDKPASGARTLEDWWTRFALTTAPNLTPKMVLAGRVDQAAALVRLLQDDARIVTIASVTTDDLLAFVASTLESQPEPTRGELFDRALVVHDALALRQLDTAARLVILLPFDDQLRRDAELVRYNHVILRAPEGFAGDIGLPPVDRAIFARQLQDAGVDEDKATRLSEAARRSIVAFRNETPAHGGTARRWAVAMASQVARRAWLVGGWSESRSGDIAELERLFGASYVATTDALRALAEGEDPLFIRVGATWKLVSDKDAWTHGKARVDALDLSALETMIQTVLGAVDPALELPVADRWKAAVYGKSRAFSSDIRHALAMTLALAGADDSTVPTGAIGTTSQWAGNVVARLLRRANDDTTGQLWQSLSDVLPLLAEAAPSVFLGAVEGGLEGEPPLLLAMFADRDADMFSDSPHTALLWALETTSWAPDHAARSVKALARLAEIDPGGRLSNRPLRSLESFFRPWLPQTALPLERRMNVLDIVRRDHPNIAWQLMLLLLDLNGIGNYSRAPDVRGWKPVKEGVPAAEFEGARRSIAESVLEVVKADPSRWPELIEQLADLPAEQRAKAAAILEELAGG